jgi:Zn finger protein HypA/HybF involved in hydrogenase expression
MEKGKTDVCRGPRLKKAFDSVDAKQIMRIQVEMGELNHLVNRIIEACVKEETPI